MARIWFRHKGDGYVGYARRAGHTRPERGLAEIEIEREEGDPPGALEITVTTEPCVSTPVLKTMWGPTAEIDTWWIARSLSRARLGTFETGEADARLRVVVHSGDAAEGATLVGADSMRFRIEAWNTAPCGITWGERTGEGAQLEAKLHQQLDWAGFVTPEAAIVRRWVRAVSARAQGAKGEKKIEDPEWCLRRTLEAVQAMRWRYSASRSPVVYPPAMLAERGSGACADSSLAVASTLLALGRRPVLILSEEHMLCAVWTRGRPKGRALLEGGGAVRDAVRAGALVPAETTGVFHAKTSARKMIRNGRRTVVKWDAARFEIGIDVDEAHATHPPLEIPPKRASAALSEPRWPVERAKAESAKTAQDVVARANEPPHGRGEGRARASGLVRWMRETLDIWHPTNRER